MLGHWNFMIIPVEVCAEAVKILAIIVYMSCSSSSEKRFTSERKVLRAVKVLPMKLWKFPVKVSPVIENLQSYS